MSGAMTVGFEAKTTEILTSAFMGNQKIIIDMSSGGRLGMLTALFLSCAKLKRHDETDNGKRAKEGKW